ncbi:MAG: beta-1,6-N-acetylglucosaminyltransferase, partial [Pikeienuella sp.]
MVKIAYLLLCHKNADYVIAQAKAYSRAGDVMAIHFDKRASAKEHAKLVQALGDDPNVAFAKRVACGWGEYSLVQASFNLLDAARAAFKDVTHYYLVSGDCYPIKSAEYIRSQLAPADRDYIEINDFMESDWIKTGIKEERLVYRHLVNERKHKKLFYGLMKAQRRLGLERALPKDLTIKIGSQ